MTCCSVSDQGRHVILYIHVELQGYSKGFGVEINKRVYLKKFSSKISKFDEH